MSVIYKARHQLMNRVVAVKMLHAHSLLDPAGLKRFQQEAQAASLLDHPNIIRVYDFGLLAEKQPYLVMDFAEGVSLTSIIEQKKALPYTYCLPIFAQVTAAIEHAHEKGILHRDLKPCNIMVLDREQQAPQVKVVDFGLATFLADSPSRSSEKLTKVGEVFGSVHYMSPEQCCGKELDERSDVYSLGCVMYECLAGVPPIQGDTILETMQMQVTTNPSPLATHAVQEKIPAELEKIVMQCLKKAPGERFQSMAELHDEIRVLLGTEETQPRRVIVRRSSPITKRTMVLVGLTIVIGLLAAFFLGRQQKVADECDSVESVQFANSSVKRGVDKGEKLIEAGDYTEAERVLTAAADNTEKFAVKDDKVTDRISSLAQLCHKRGQCDTAERLLKRSLAISEKLFGKNDPKTRERVQDLAAFYMSIGDYEKAEPLYNLIMPADQARKTVEEASASEASADSK